MNRTIRPLAALLAVLLSVALLSGCGPSAEEAAAGTYTLDKQNIRDAAAAEAARDPAGAASEEAQMAMAMIEEMEMTLTLAADGKATSSVTMMGQTQSTSGTWTISGEAVTVTMSQPGEEAESITGTLKGGTLEMTPPEGSEMPFEKMVFKKQPAK